MQSITIKISKGFGKAITLELPTGAKHIITQSTNAYLYNDLAALAINSITGDIGNKINNPHHEMKATDDTKINPSVKNGEYINGTFYLPNDFEFADDKNITLENDAD